MIVVVTTRGACPLGLASVAMKVRGRSRFLVSMQVLLASVD